MSVFCGNELDPTDRPDAALIFGGDGTVHRHLGGLAGKSIPTLVVPIGSANDFAASIGLDDVGKALVAWQRFCDGAENIRAVDVGTIAPLAREGQHLAQASEGGSAWPGKSLDTLHFVPSGPRRDLPQLGPRIMQSQSRHRTEAQLEQSYTAYFVCIAGTGLDAEVNRLALGQPHWLRGHGGYVVGLLQVLSRFRAPHIKVDVEADGQWKTAINEPGFLIAAGNGPQYGHGMRLAHQAQMDDGLIDLCFVGVLGKLRLLLLFGLVYRGRHLGLKEVGYFRATRVRLWTDPVTEVFADGEYICRTPVEIGLRPKALHVIVSR